MAKVQAALSQYFKDFKYVFYCMLHPFKGFWELKHDKKARTAVSVTMYILLVLSQLISKQFTAYSFNELRLIPEAINIFSDIVVFVLFQLGYYNAVQRRRQRQGCFPLYGILAYALRSLYTGAYGAFPDNDRG